MSSVFPIGCDLLEKESLHLIGQWLPPSLKSLRFWHSRFGPRSPTTSSYKSQLAYLYTAADLIINYIIRYEDETMRKVYAEI